VTLDVLQKVKVKG